MSSKFKILSIALVALLAFGFYSATTKADVTGSFGLNILFNPIDCENVAVLDENGEPVPLADQPCERTVFKFDFETAITINITISGLTLGIHSHIGTTGLEDVILSYATTLGAINLNGQFVFAQPFGAIIDGTGMLNFACFENAVDSGICDLFFVKKRMTVSVDLGGVVVSNLAVLEDLNFPECSILPHPLFGDPFCIAKPQSGVYTAQSQAFAFGDLIEISGQTPSGITVTGRTGICFQDDFNLIKKHIFPGVVNRDCLAGAQTPSPKPPLFFDFESLSIEGVPLATDVLLDASVFCTWFVQGCTFSTALTFTGAVIFNPITLSLDFDTVTGPFSFSGLQLTLPAGVATITITFNSAFVLTRIDVTLNATINPDTSPGTLTARLRLVPGTGLTRLILTMTVRRPGLTFSATANFTGPGVTLSSVVFSLAPDIGSAVVLRSSVTYTLTPGMLSGSLSATLNF